MTNEDGADLWKKDLTGVIQLWIDVGVPGEKLIRKACGRANKVIVYSYGGRAADMWFSQNSNQFKRLNNSTVLNLPLESSRAISKMVQRNMKLHCTIQYGQLWMGNGEENVMIELTILKEPLVG